MKKKIIIFANSKMVNFMQPAEMDMFVNPFDEQTKRSSFIKKVYALLFGAFMLTGSQVFVALNM